MCKIIKPNNYPSLSQVRIKQTTKCPHAISTLDIVVALTEDPPARASRVQTRAQTRARSEKRPRSPVDQEVAPAQATRAQTRARSEKSPRPPGDRDTPMDYVSGPKRRRVSTEPDNHGQPEQHNDEEVEPTDVEVGVDVLQRVVVDGEEEPVEPERGPEVIPWNRRVRRAASKANTARCKIDDMVEADVALHVLQTMDIVCEHCEARLMPLELYRMNTPCCANGKVGVVHVCLKPDRVVPRCYRNHTPCCNNGKVGVQHPQWPEDDDHFKKYKDHIRDAGFIKDIRKYNQAFKFTSIDAEKPLENTPGPRTFAIAGQVHYYLGPMDPPVGRNGQRERARYAQVYVLGTEAEQSACRQEEQRTIDQHIVGEIQRLLNTHNPYAALYKHARDILRESGCPDASIVLRSLPGGTGNLPVADEIAVLIDGPTTQRTERIILLSLRGVAQLGPHRQVDPPARGREVNGYDVVLPGANRRHDEAAPFVKIFETNKHYDALYFPLIFVLGEPGWAIGQTWRYQVGQVWHEAKVSMLAFAKFMLFQRTLRHSVLHAMGRLFLEYLVIQFAKIENSRLCYLERHQDHVRQDSYSNYADAIARRVGLENIGIKTVLPASFHGSDRYMQQQYQDAMAVVRQFGKPDLFITVTCNPEWDEIKEILRGQVDEMGRLQLSTDRADLIVRVFLQKLKCIEHALTVLGILGRVVAFVRVIEFQKRGLPHAHILLTLHDEDKIRTVEDIDAIVCAEMPDPTKHPRLHDIVKRNMVHECKTKRCSPDGTCVRHYPKPYCSETRMAENKYPVYRRRPGQVLNLRVVPYNPTLLLMFNCHINVEVCSSLSSIKYLFKYIHKGQDRIAYRVGQSIDEVKRYRQARYITAHEAATRILETPLLRSSHSVHRLAVHEEGKQSVRFEANGNDEEELGLRRTTLMAFFALCSNPNNVDKEGVPASARLYAEIPLYFTWHTGNNGEWKPRDRQGDKAIGRMYAVSPRQTERFHLRMLLCHRRGPKSFADIRTVNGICHGTYKEACQALGLLQNDDEYLDCMRQAATRQMGGELRNLFVTILVHTTPSSPAALWQENAGHMSEDHARRLAQNQAPNTVHGAANAAQGEDAAQEDGPNEANPWGLNVAKALALRDIDDRLREFGGDWRLAKFPDLPQLGDIEPFLRQPVNNDQAENNRLIAIEEAYSPEELQATLAGEQHANEEQLAFLEDVKSELALLPHQRSRCFFLSGEGGAGKSFVSNLLLAHVRSTGKIAIAVASTGLAALNLRGGSTAHSRFKIPLRLDDTSTCFVKKQDDLGKLLQRAELFIWDECSMIHKHAIDAVDRLLKDLCDDTDRPFGGKTFVFSGDFKQTLPVVPKASREQLIEACVKQSIVWQSMDDKKCITSCHLTQNMRANNDVAFSSMLRAIGNGTFGDDDPNNHAIRTIDGFDQDYIRLPDDLVCDVAGPGPALDKLVNFAYPNLPEVPIDQLPEYLASRAILTPKNEGVAEVNSKILGLVSVADPTHVRVYASGDSVDPANGASVEEAAIDFPVELLNTINVSGFPPHELKLKVNATIMLLRNLCPSQGLCNGTRLMVCGLWDKCIMAQILTGAYTGQIAFIPRMTHVHDGPDNTLPFVLKRFQFPVCLAFAMTINKSQGQTLPHVGIYLPEPVFSHGQLYVAMSRVQARNNIKILTTGSTVEGRTYTKNIVYDEVLDKPQVHPVCDLAQQQ